jgi:hypothetical protein
MIISSYSTEGEEPLTILDLKITSQGTDDESWFSVNKLETIQVRVSLASDRVNSKT